MRSDDIEALLAFLHARLAEDEHTATAATQGEWVWSREFVTPPGYHHRTIGPLEPGDAAHIARHDPARVLAGVEAQRALLADLASERHLVIEDDCWYTCTAATEERDGGENCDDDRRGDPCDCGRDARVLRWLRLLVLPYATHPDYQEAWRP